MADDTAIDDREVECAFADRRLNAQLHYFSLRGEAPLFCGQPVALSLDPSR